MEFRDPIGEVPQLHLEGIRSLRTVLPPGQEVPESAFGCVVPVKGSDEDSTLRLTPCDQGPLVDGAEVRKVCKASEHLSPQTKSYGPCARYKGRK